MKHPPYHLRINKAIDRFLLIDLLQKLEHENVLEIGKYSYYGLGGPFLEDFRLMNLFFPRMKLHSLESSPETYKRQKFHLFSKDVILEKKDIAAFLSQTEISGKSVVWFDFTDFKSARITLFQDAIRKIGTGGIIKMTVSSDPDPLKNTEYLENFKSSFSHFLPPEFDPAKYDRGAKFAELQAGMFRLAAERAGKEMPGFYFQPLCNHFYKDGQIQMFSISGMVVVNGEEKGVVKRMKKWKFNNLGWEPPKSIDLPDLSLKEIMFLEGKASPRAKKPGEILAKVLKYRVDENDEKNLQKLNHYFEFSRFYPRFVKIVS